MRRRPAPRRPAHLDSADQSFLPPDMLPHLRAPPPPAAQAAHLALLSPRRALICRRGRPQGVGSQAPAPVPAPVPAPAPARRADARPGRRTDTRAARRPASCTEPVGPARAGAGPQPGVRLSSLPGTDGARGTRSETPGGNRGAGTVIAVGSALPRPGWGAAAHGLTSPRRGRAGRAAAPSGMRVSDSTRPTLRCPQHGNGRWHPPRPRPGL